MLFIVDFLVVVIKDNDMKKFIILICLYLSACATPTYTFNSNAAVSSGKNQTIFVTSPDKSVLATKLKTFFEAVLKDNGFKVVSNKQKAKYVFIYGITRKEWKSLETQAIWGPTSINSINTNNSGTILGTSTKDYNIYSPYNASSYTNYNANYMGTSNTNVSYNYGITGYDNVIVNHFRIIFASLILDMKTEQVVYEGTLVGTQPIDSSEFYNYIQDVYTKYPLLIQTSISLTCETKNALGSCFEK